MWLARHPALTLESRAGVVLWPSPPVLERDGGHSDLPGRARRFERVKGSASCGNLGLHPLCLATTPPVPRGYTPPVPRGEADLLYTLCNLGTVPAPNGKGFPPMRRATATMRAGERSQR